jgi:hypothetical protein
MPATYSLNVGTITESYRKPDIFTVLQDLPDNTQKLISPRDVRDAFLTTWASSVFKITTPNNLSNLEYIGIDSGNPNDRDVKKKIYLGKRSYGNLDIMNSSLLQNSDADIFIYNTKPDSVSQASTKLAILSGTDSNLHLYSPYIESYATGSSVSLNIVNPSLSGGAINLFSSKGRVSINGIIFPTAEETGLSASNGRILRYTGTYPSGYFRWDDATLTLTSIGSPGITTSIYGNPVQVNGFSLEFVDESIVPVTIGGVTQGSSFSNDSFSNSVTGTYSDWPLVEVLRKVLYPYIEPVLQLSVFNEGTGTTYAEVGTTISVSVTFSVTTYARDSNEYVFQHLVRDWQEPATNSLYYSLTFSDLPGSITHSSFTYSRYGATISSPEIQLAAATDPVFISTASLAPFADGGGGFSFSTRKAINFIPPFAASFQTFTFSGLSSSAGIRDLLVNNNIMKVIEPYSGGSQSFHISIVGGGYLYFAYPQSYGYLNYIKDPNGFVIHDFNSLTYSAFTFSVNTFAPDVMVSQAPIAPYSYYEPYVVYRTIATCSNTLFGPFELIF